MVLNTKIKFSFILAATLLIQVALEFEKSGAEKSSRPPKLTKLGSENRKFNFKQKIYEDHQPISPEFCLICLQKI